MKTWHYLSPASAHVDTHGEQISALRLVKGVCAQGETVLGMTVLWLCQYGINFVCVVASDDECLWFS